MDTRLLEHDEFTPAMITLALFASLIGWLVWYETSPETIQEKIKKQNIAVAQETVQNHLLSGRPGKFPSIATRYKTWESIPNLYVVESYVDIAGERKPYSCFVVNDGETPVGEAPVCTLLGQGNRKGGVYIADKQ